MLSKSVISCICSSEYNGLKNFFTFIRSFLAELVDSLHLVSLSS